MKYKTEIIRKDWIVFSDRTSDNKVYSELHNKISGKFIDGIITKTKEQAILKFKKRLDIMYYD